MIIETNTLAVAEIGGPAFLAHTKEKVSNIVSLTALRLAFFMGYELYIYNQFIIIKIATVNYSSVLFYGDTLRNTKTKGTVLQSLSVTNKNHWYGVMGI